MSVFDAVLSQHPNPDTCGVVKFNVQLAQHLGITHDRLVLIPNPRWDYPLLSLKLSELRESPVILEALRTYPQPYAVFWHDAGDPVVSARAQQVWYASDVGCPATIQGNATRVGKSILTFGMAHKIDAESHLKLKALLDATNEPYTVCLSSAIHEGHPWDTTTTDTAWTMRSIYGEAFRFLGYLADDALAREIRDAHAVALFYHPAARANNTTLWAALNVGTPVITNLDKQSPKELQHNRSVFDLDQLTDWPDAPVRREVRMGGWKAASVYSWDRVTSMLKAPAHV